MVLHKEGEEQINVIYILRTLMINCCLNPKRVKRSLRRYMARIEKQSIETGVKEAQTT